MTKNFDRPNVLVAGGAGFIGANLCTALTDEYNVVCVDDYSFGHESAIDELLGNSHFEFIRHDIREPFDFSSHAAIEKFRIAHVGFQHIIHTAGAGSCRTIAHDPIGTERTLSEGTRRLLDLAVSFHAAYYLVSDALVYGSGEGEFTEDREGTVDANALVNRAAEAKRFAETLSKTYAQEFSLSVSILRVGLVYGPRMFLDDGRFFSTLISAAFSKKHLPVPAGIQSLQALFSRDLSDAVKKLLASEPTGVFNISGATPYTIAEITESIARALEMPVAIDPSGIDEDMAAFWKGQAVGLSIKKIKEEIGWFPIVRLEDGMRETVEYLKSLRGVRMLETLNPKP